MKDKVMLLQQLLLLELTESFVGTRSSFQNCASSDILEAISWHEVIRQLYSRRHGDAG